ncbi:MAG: cobalamin-binding protein [Chloroflexi bacterium]|nr:cobalamin-binding protein [Chloroflexota bacterium]
MKRIIYWLWIVGLLLTACTTAAIQPTPTASTTAPTVVVDGLGRSLSLNLPAQKIVSLSPSNTEILFALGAGSHVIGRDSFSDYPAEATAVPVVGGSMNKYNMEEIVTLQPDLVLAAEINTPEQIKSLEEVGLNVYYLNNPSDLDGLYANLQKVGQLVGREEEAEQLVASSQQRVAALEEALKNVDSRTRVFYELDGSDPAKPWAPGPGAFITTLIDMAGGESVSTGLQSEWAQISQEELLLQDPEIILLGDAAYGVSPEQVAARPGWNTLQAVKNQRVYPFDDNLVSRPGPRLVDGLIALAKIFHPEETAQLE